MKFTYAFLMSVVVTSAQSQAQVVFPDIAVPPPVAQMLVHGAPTFAPNLPNRTRRCLITDSGAVGDSKTVNTKAIQAAIDKCARNKEGGVLVVPKGTFLSGTIFLKQGVDLLVEKDGVLMGTVNIDDYPALPRPAGGLEGGGTAAFINADGVNGLTISGEGVIDGNGELWEENHPRRPVGRTANNPGLTPPEVGRGRPRLIAIKNSTDVRVAGLHFNDQASWCLWVLYSQNVEIDGVSITAAHNIPSSDGIDIDSSKHVHVNHSFLDDNDDCISIKSGKDTDGLRVNRPTEDVLIENTHFAYGQGGVAMGSETSGGIRNVTTLNCLFDDDNWAPIRFKSQPSRGGVVENITYKDIVLHGTRQAFEMNMEWRMVGPRLPDSDPLPIMRNITISDVSGDVKSVGNIHGLAGSPIQGITFIDCKVMAQRGFTLDHARNVDMRGLSLDVAQGNPITETDVLVDHSPITTPPHTPDSPTVKPATTPAT